MPSPPPIVSAPRSSFSARAAPAGGDVLLSQVGVAASLESLTACVPDAQALMPESTPPLPALYLSLQVIAHQDHCHLRQ